MSHSLEPFAQLLGGDDSRIDLARACLMIAQDAYPGLDVERYLGEIERMAIRLRARMPRANAAEEKVVALNLPGVHTQREPKRFYPKRELAAQVPQGAPLAIAATKRVIVESADWDSSEAFARQGEVIRPVFTSAT